MTNSVSKPLTRTAELEKLQEEYMLILAEIVEYIYKNQVNQLNDKLFQKDILIFGGNIPQKLVSQKP